MATSPTRLYPCRPRLLNRLARPRTILVMCAALIVVFVTLFAPSVPQPVRITAEVLAPLVFGLYLASAYGAATAAGRRRIVSRLAASRRQADAGTSVSDSRGA